MIRRVVCTFAVGLAAACSGGTDVPPAGAGGATQAQAALSASPSPTASPTPTLPAQPPDAAALDSVRLALQPLVTVERPTGVFQHAGVLYITEIAGRVRVVRDGVLVQEPLVDISSDVGTEGESGLLGMAFAPDGEHVYLSYTNKQIDTRIVEFAFDGSAVDLSSRREILAVDQPHEMHNGGNIAFGPDGMLWIGLGDGGHTETAPLNAQDLTTLLGSMLRIDPRPSAGSPYTVPADNPFVGRADARPEIWAKGVRNPWRWSFDARGLLWIGDVGGHYREEIDVLDPATDAGANLGWPALEGTRRHLKGVPVPPVPHVPLIEYSHEDGACSVVGGFVYRGSALPGLRGAYVYADTCQATLRAASVAGGQVTASRVFPDRSVSRRTLVSLGEDAAGELYVVSIDGPVYRVVAA